jgi:hypothetical protein
VLVITLAGLIVEAHDTNLIDHIRQAILVPVGAAGIERPLEFPR